MVKMNTHEDNAVNKYNEKHLEFLLQSTNLLNHSLILYIHCNGTGSLIKCVMSGLLGFIWIWIFQYMNQGSVQSCFIFQCQNLHSVMHSVFIS